MAKPSVIGAGLPDDARISIADAARLLGRSKASVWRYIQQAQLPRPIAVPASARTTLRLGDVRRLLTGNADTTKSPD